MPDTQYVYRASCIISPVLFGLSVKSVMYMTNRNAMVEENRRVMDCVVDCIKFLTCQMIAFGGDKPCLY